jgi:hypothetical protein
MPYLLPDSATTPAYAEPLEDIFQRLLVGITGLQPQLVRPRWQPEPPNLPDFSINWVAFGITEGDKDKFPWTKQLDAFKMVLERDEELSVLFSFYGPNCQSICALFHDGIYIDQNRADLATAGVKLIDLKETRQLPALMKEKWMKRWDIRGDFRRRVQRIYTTNAIERFDGVDLNNDEYVTPITITPPTT